jgi:hypothetical protein
MTKTALLGVAALGAALAAFSQPAAACGFGGEACPVILAANGNAPLSILPSAHDGKKSVKPRAKKKSARSGRDGRKDDKEERAQSDQHEQDGIAPGAFAAAARYIIVPPHYPTDAETKITVVNENELSEIDLLAGTVRVVEPDQANEIDLSVDEKTRLARAQANGENGEDVRQADPAKEEDDDIFSRVLMTFAGALAAASAMRVFIV